MMIFLPLSYGRLMAVEAIHALLGMHAQFVFMHHRNLLPRMALGAFARGANQSGGRLFNLDRRTPGIDEHCPDNQSKADNESNENGSKRHAAILRGIQNGAIGKHDQRNPVPCSAVTTLKGHVAAAKRVA
jgi:hypothetical protein